MNIKIIKINAGNITDRVLSSPINSDKRSISMMFWKSGFNRSRSKRYRAMEEWRAEVDGLPLQCRHHFVNNRAWTLSSSRPGFSSSTFLGFLTFQHIQMCLLTRGPASINKSDIDWRADCSYNNDALSGYFCSFYIKFL